MIANYAPAMKQLFVNGGNKTAKIYAATDVFNL